jgi:hypothetical protein
MEIFHTYPHRWTVYQEKVESGDCDFDFFPRRSVIQRRLPLKMRSRNDGLSILGEELIP